jgi:glycosyltransferase involved in cell wall biosynthesis
MTKISIITINYNNKIGLQKTIESVVNQTYNNLEYIVIDGGSKDGSVVIIEQYSEKINHWISEKDTGVYNAMNKGIKISSGEYLLFLNSGDFFLNKNVILNSISFFNKKISFYYGNLHLSTNNIPTTHWKPASKLSFSYFLEYSIPHPACFIKKEMFTKYGLYNENLKIVSDWEFFITTICKYNESFQYIDIDISNFDETGISSADENRKKQLEEKEWVFQNHFPLFIQDGNRLKFIENKKIQQFSIIKKRKIAWKLLKAFSNVLLFFINEKPKKEFGFFSKI